MYGPAPRRSVLVVDDYDDARELFETYFRFVGFDVVTAASGREAVAAARLHRPDAIVLDVHLPDQDGFAVLRALRAENVLRSTRIVMLSADIRPAVREEALRRGADAFCVKPCLPDALEAELRRLLGDTQLAMASPAMH